MAPRVCKDGPRTAIVTLAALVKVKPPYIVAAEVTVPRLPIVLKETPEGGAAVPGNVVAKAGEDCAEQLPAASQAETVKLYVVEADRPVIEEPGLVTVPSNAPFMKIL